MSALSAILQHERAAQTLKPASALPQAATGGTSGSNASTGSSSSASGDSSTISANDFLTLLVTEMQNQDPTADTDPNEYIDQLVQVNSLEQLIDINQTLTTAYPSTSSSTSSTDSGAQPGLKTNNPSALATNNLQATAGSSLSSLTAALTPQAAAAKTSLNSQAPGNLAIPDATPAALRVAQSLSGRSRGVSGQSNSLQRTSTPSYSAQ